MPTPKRKIRVVLEKSICFNTVINEETLSPQKGDMIKVGGTDFFVVKIIHRKTGMTYYLKKGK